MFAEGYHTGRAADAGPLGFVLLLIGWLGLSESIAWLANPLLLTSWILVRTERYVAAAIFAALAIASMLSFLGVNVTLVDEGGGRASVNRVGLGYWLWLSSALSSFVGCIGISTRTISSRGQRSYVDR